MIRPFTCLCLLAACGSGLYLYSEKHQTALLDRDIGRVIHETEAARARTGLLRAEWALLNEPGRLQDMADRYLALKAMAPTQFVQLASLSTHLPAPVAVVPGGSTDDDAADPVASTAPAPPPASVPVLLPDQHPMQPAVADARPADKLLAQADAKPHAQHRVALADRQDGGRYQLRPVGAPLPLAAPQPLGASVYSALARPMQVASRRPAFVAAMPHFAPATPLVGSALGGRSALPPPVPYGQ